MTEALTVSCIPRNSHHVRIMCTLSLLVGGARMLWNQKCFLFVCLIYATWASVCVYILCFEWCSIPIMNSLSQREEYWGWENGYSLRYTCGHCSYVVSILLMLANFLRHTCFDAHLIEFLSKILAKLKTLRLDLWLAAFEVGQNFVWNSHTVLFIFRWWVLLLDK